MFYHCHEVGIPCIVQLSVLYKPFILLLKQDIYYNIKVESFCYMLLLVINIL